MTQLVYGFLQREVNCKVLSAAREEVKALLPGLL